ncbi:MAG TPA: membrane dipeptidase [Polyangiaceae bacterium]|nr:membrane dipeptidase [Polyangiaceae bacterium]
MTITGYADLHCHPMSHLGFGGYRQGGLGFFWGTPTDPIDQALPCCKVAHAPLGRGGVVPSLTEHEQPNYDGYDTFVSWPRHTTVIHQQMYKDCIERAFQSGLKLIVASAVNNEMLADLYDNGYPIDSSDETSIAAQIAGMKAFATQCSTWMQIVTTPAEARAAIAAGKLAVVLAIEVDSICGGAARRDGDLDPAKTDAIVQKYFDMGVRLINPLHLVDNALGGTAIYDDRFNLSNHYLFAKYDDQDKASWWYQAASVVGGGDLADVRMLLGANRGNDALINVYGKGYPTYMKQLGLVGHANSRTLTPAGSAFVNAMMNRGMLVDVEHMSSHTLDAALTLAEGRSYPLVSSHTGFRGIAVPRTKTGPNDPTWVPGCANEGMRSDTQIKRLVKLGSIIGIGGHAGLVQDLTVDSSKGWARAYHYARSLGVNRVAIGTDMNGFPTAPGPRFRYDPFTQKIIPLEKGDTVRALQYGKDLVPYVNKVLTRAALGKQTYDYNINGFAHYGVLPDFTLDVALQLTAPDDLGDFFQSAEALIQVWETCEQLAVP